jgi:hypothetical protein
MNQYRYYMTRFCNALIMTAKHNIKKIIANQNKGKTPRKLIRFCKNLKKFADMVTEN